MQYHWKSINGICIASPLWIRGGGGGGGGVQVVKIMKMVAHMRSYNFVFTEAEMSSFYEIFIPDCSGVND